MDNEKRNNYQQYDLIEIFKNFETKINKGIHCATLAVVISSSEDIVKCMPFPIEEDTDTKVIEAYNIGKCEYKVGEKCLVIYTDRDFRYNKETATTDTNTIVKTSNATLHSDLYGIVIPINKASSTSDSSYTYQPSYNSDGSITFNKVKNDESSSTIKTASLLPQIDNDTKQWKIGDVLSNVKAQGIDGTSASIKLNGNNIVIANTDSSGKTLETTKQIIPTIANNKWTLNDTILGDSKGADGATPEIIDNEWVINNKSTGVRALGEDGKTPEITQNGNVLSIKLDGIEKFNANLKGEDGLTPEIAQNGNILSVKVGGVEKFNADLKGKNGSDGKTYIPSWNGNKIQFSLDGVVQDTLTSADLKGKDGSDGVGISDISIANGLITIAKTDGSTPIKGVNIKGADGVGIKDISIIDGKLTITKTDNTTPINAINVKGDVGATGEKGDKGDKGDTGANGTDGKDGTSIASVVDYYLKSSNNTNITIDGNTWSTSIPTLDSTNKYLWNYEKILDTNGKTINTTSPTLIGSLGEDGVSITSVTDYYQSNNSESVPTIPTYSDGYSGWSTTPTQVTSTSKFLWNFERIDFSDGKFTTTTPSIIGNFAIGVKSLEMYYGVNNDSNNAPTTMNTDKVTPTSSNRYLWMKTKTTYDDDSISWTDAQIISVYGEKGDSGRGIKSIVTYYALSSTTETPSDSDFDETSKTPTSDNKYLWEKTITYYDNGTDSGWTTPHIVGVFGKDGSDADVTFANCCNALGITTDTTSSGIYQDNGKLAINADVILTDTLLADKIEALDVTANNLKVKMANVDGELTANKIKITTDGNNTIPDPYSTSGSYECKYNSDLANYTMVNGKVFGAPIVSTIIPYFRDAGMTTYSEKPYGTYPATIIGGISGVTITSNGESYSTSYFARGINYTHKTFDSEGNQLTSGSYSLTLPDKSGTIATLDDVTAATGTDLSSYLTIANAKTTYAPISHTHAISDITNLQTTLDGKASTSHTHNLYELSDVNFAYELDSTIGFETDIGEYLNANQSEKVVYITNKKQLWVYNESTSKFDNVSGRYTISCTVDDIVNLGGIANYLTTKKGVDITEVTDVYIKTSAYPPYRMTYDLTEMDYVIYYGDKTLKIDGIMDTPLGQYFQGLIYRIQEAT